MKAKPIGMLILGVVLVISTCAWNREQPLSQEPRLITVTGDAEVRVVPDEVILTLGVETWDKDLSLAKTQNDDIVGRVLARVLELGVELQHVQTDYVNIEPRYRHGTYDEADFIGYFVRKTIVIKLKDLSKFERLLAETLDLGANYVLGIQFLTTELRKHRDEARGLAIRAAQEKASALAGELGEKVGAPRTIYEQQGGWRSSYDAWWERRWGGGMAQNVIQEAGVGVLSVESGVAPGQITVNARVTVEFELTD